jgi:hypothetical protein
LKKEVAYPSETSVPAYWNIWCHSSEDQSHLNPKKWGKMSLRNFSIRILDYMVSQSRNPKSLQPWRRQHVPSKRRLIFNELHGVKSQKTQLFINQQISGRQSRRNTESESLLTPAAAATNITNSAQTTRWRSKTTLLAAPHPVSGFGLLQTRSENGGL